MTTFIPSTDGVEIALHDLGGSGPPLLLLHATGFHARAYRVVAEGLHRHFHVWAPDLRGHGDSRTPDIALPWRGMADDALAVLDHLGLDEPVRAVGHSMGGATIVNTELRRPGTIRAAWLFEPIIFPGDRALPQRENPIAEIARRRRADFGSFDEVVDRYRTRPLFAGVPEPVLRDYVELGFRETDDGVTLKMRPETEARAFEGVDPEIFGRLSAVDCPITVIGSGGADPASHTAPLVAEALPHGRFSSWPDNTHLGPFEDPERAAEEIVAALT